MVVALGLLVAMSPIGGRAQDPRPNPDGPIERAGAQIDRLLGDIERNFRGLSAEVRQRFAEARQRIDDLGVEARVYSRLHWDKALHEAELAVEAREGGLVVLHGVVPDADAREKAVKLTVDTLGVERVVDRLRVAEPTAEGAAPRGRR